MGIVMITNFFVIGATAKACYCFIAVGEDDDLRSDDLRSVLVDFEAGWHAMELIAAGFPGIVRLYKSY